MLRRKKGGSSLIYVIIIFMFVTTVSTAMLSMISANYRARVIENKRIENLYGSDSGIDVAYNIMGKTFDAATKYGYYRVKTLTDAAITDKSKCTYAEEYAKFNTDIDDLNAKINELKAENNADNTTKATIQANNTKIDQFNQLIEDDKNFMKVLVNEEFKSGFKAFFDDNDNKLNDDFKLKNSVENKQYVYQVSSLNSMQTTMVKYEANNDVDKQAALVADISTPYNTNGNDTLNYGIESSTDGHTQTIQFTKTANKAYTVKITSDFESKNAPISVDNNNRTIEANYVIKIPNYDDIFFGNGTSNDKYLALQDRGLTVKGNMNVDNVRKLTVNGDAFVEGEYPNVNDSDNDRTYEKYSGGIKINNSNNIEFGKDVITRNTFNIQDYTTATIGGNLYARNAYIGNIADADGGFAEESKLNINTAGAGKVILDNDLTVKAKDSEINMNDFYGINDKNIKYKDVNGVEDTGKIDDIIKSSSSIIINGYKGGSSDSKVNISNSAYIMGTAHIATDNNYQTGESGAVKGNYIAYSVLDSDNTSEKFSYHEPLYLLDEDNVFIKAEHFKEYWDEQGNVDTGGIIWPSNTDNIYSVGALVYTDGENTFVKEPNYSLSLERAGLTYNDSGEICKKRIDFASKVYKFGQPAEIGEYNQSVLTDFDSLVNFNSISEYKDLGDNERIVLNPDEDITIVLKNKDIDDDKEYEDSDGNIIESNKLKIIKADSNNEINAVIATKGNVIIDGDVTLSGTLICTGDLNISGNDEVTINYDSDVISRLQSQNEDLFKDVFGGMIVNNDETSTLNKSEGEILDSSYDINKFLESKLWKLTK